MMQVEQQARSAIEEGVFARLEMSLTPRYFGNTGKQLDGDLCHAREEDKNFTGREHTVASRPQRPEQLIS